MRGRRWRNDANVGGNICTGDSTLDHYWSPDRAPNQAKTMTVKKEADNAALQIAELVAQGGQTRNYVTAYDHASNPKEVQDLYVAWLCEEIRTLIPGTFRWDVLRFTPYVKE